MQHSAALSCDADFIITRNAKDFETSIIEVVSPFFKNTNTLNSYYSTDKEKEEARKQIKEDARKFYVAISRAKSKELGLTTS